MRLFASDRVMKVLDRLGLKEGEMIESSMVSHAIEKAQKRVEENNFGIRKRLLEYDDVMNKQRTYIYSRRNHALLGERIGIDIANMLSDIVENLIMTYNQPADYPELTLEIFKVLAMETPFTEEEYKNMDRETAIDRLLSAANEAFDRRTRRIREVAMPVIREWVEERGAQGDIIVPITDGKRVFHLRVDIRKAYDTECAVIVKEWHKAILLVTIDELWKEHLRELDQLRQSVQNASYEQKDPLVIYKVESFHMFENMLNNLNVKAISALMRGQIYLRPANTTPAPQQQAQAEQQAAPAPEPRRQPEVKQAAPEMPRDYSRYNASRGAGAPGLPGEQAQRQAASARQGEQQRPMPAKAAPRINRNDPCPCGSGKKYKNCHGRGL